VYITWYTLAEIPHRLFCHAERSEGSRPTSLGRFAPHASGTVIAAAVPVGGGPEGLAVNNTAGEVYVTNALSNTVSVISGSSVIATYLVGAEPRAVAYDPSAIGCTLRVTREPPSRCWRSESSSCSC